MAPPALMHAPCWLAFQATGLHPLLHSPGVQPAKERQRRAARRWAGLLLLELAVHWDSEEDMQFLSAPLYRTGVGLVWVVLASRLMLCTCCRVARGGAR